MLIPIPVQSRRRPTVPCLPADTDLLDADGTIALSKPVVGYANSYEDLVELVENDRDAMWGEIFRILDKDGALATDAVPDLRLRYLYTDRHRPWRSVHNIRIRIVAERDNQDWHLPATNIHY